MRRVRSAWLLAAAVAIVAAGAVQAGAPPEVSVRFGDHDGFSRAVFDWPIPTAYDVKTGPGAATISFERPARFRFERFAFMAPRWIRKARTQGGEVGAVVEFDIPAGATVKHFRNGKRVVIDVRAAVKPPEQMTPKKPAKRQVKTQPEPVKLPAPTMAPTVAPTGAPPPPATAASRTEIRSLAELDQPGGRLIVGAHRTVDGVRLTFAWAKPVAAAVFQRADHLWIVFDRPRRADLSAVGGGKDDLAGLIQLAEQLPSRRATILRFRFDPRLHPAAYRLNAAWIVDMKTSAERPKNPILVNPEPIAPGGPRVYLSAIDTGNGLSFEDPEVGDSLIVVPLAAPGQGVVTGRRFVQFAVLETIQGIAISPKARGIQVTPARTGVAVTNLHGLLISHGWMTSDRLEIEGGSVQPEAAIFRIERWRRGALGARNASERRLLEALSNAPEAGRNTVRFELAKFYFAHGLAVEALGVMARIVEAEPRVAADPQFRAVRGAANFLAHRLEAAEPDLFHPELDEDAEVALWRGAWAGATRDWDRARREFAVGMDAISTLPADLRPMFRLAMAEVGLARDDLTTVEVQIAAMERDRASPAERSRAAYALARVDHITGDHAAALDGYDGLIAGRYRPIQVRAKSDRLRLLRERGEITAEQAIDQLETLRFAWRGDALELDFLTRLGRLYIESGDFRSGFSIMRQAIAYFPEDGGRDLAREMNEIFAKLFLNGEADRMDPIVALGLYFDFRELTPIGAPGDEMIRRLADRLVSVDLLARAADLLDHQVNFRLRGEAKAKVGTRLAIIHLLNRRPELGLRALRISRWARLADELVAERRHLEARALTDLRRFDEATELLADDNSREADILRADIHWRAKDWRQAAPAFGRLLGERWRDPAPLEPLERQQVMQLAIALALNEDRPALARLKRDYQDKLADLPEGDALDVIAAADADRRRTDFRNLAGAIAQVRQLEAFMTSYRERLRQDARQVN